MTDDIDYDEVHLRTRPVPLTEQEWNWRVAACWLVVLAGTALLFGCLVAWAL